MLSIVTAAVKVLKPFVLVWAGLNAFDDMTRIIRIGRLAVSVVPFPPGRQPNPKEMCGICDDVMEDLMVSAADNLNAIPCTAACFRAKRCVEMCTRLQEVMSESNEFPCEAAGFCDRANESDKTNTFVVPECKTGAFFSCEPSRYCRRSRKRKGVKITCELKPGIGHWVGLKKRLARDHAGALASGLFRHTQCGDPGAGPYCIAKPKGVGLVAEFVGHFMSLIIGTYKSIIAIESRGGSDDRQWLTFWVILTIILFVERFCARVILSSFPYYYQVKLLILIWLIWQNGAETCYRKLRRFLESRVSLFSEEEARRVLERMRMIEKVVVRRNLPWLGLRTKSVWKTDDWDYDHEGGNNMSRITTDPSHELYELSKFILSREGVQKLGECKNISTMEKMHLVEHAASVVSFQPRFLRVHVVGTADGPRGELPVMDTNGLADPYVVCRLVPKSRKPYPTYGASTKVLHNTLTPYWNEDLEINLRGGVIDNDGFFRCEDDIQSTQLELIVRDADIGVWKCMYYLFRFLSINLVLGTAVARINGDLTQVVQQASFGAALVFPCFAISYVMAVLRKSDYETVGQCTIPIGMLMNQSEHALLLTLREPDDDKSKRRRKKPAATNSTGGFGILRVRLMLSER